MQGVKAIEKKSKKSLAMPYCYLYRCICIWMPKTCLKSIKMRTLTGTALCIPITVIHY